MSYDAVAFMEALEPEEVILPRGFFGRLIVRFTNLFRREENEKSVRKKTYRPRILSAQEFEKHRDRFAELSEETDPERADKVIQAFLTDLGIPWDRVYALPAGAQEELIESFFVLQARANGASPEKLAAAWRESREGAKTASPQTRTATRRTGPS